MLDEWDIIAVNIGRSDGINEFIRKVGWSGDVVLFGKDIARQIGVRALPTTLPVTREGKLILFAEQGILTFWMIGVREWDAPCMVQFFREVACRLNVSEGT